MATKQCICDTCNRTFLLDESGLCPYCGSSAIEVVGETDERPDPPYKPDPPTLEDYLVLL